MGKLLCPDCESANLSGPDHEGFYDCHDCGAAWKPGCPECLEHPGWAHDDQSRRREPADVCRACHGSGVKQS